MGPSSTFTAWIPRGSVNPTKFVTRSEQIFFHISLLARMFLMAFMKKKELSSGSKAGEHDCPLFEIAMPPLVRRAAIPQGPNFNIILS